MEHFSQKLSISGRYEVRLHENFWLEKGTRLPVTREIFMVALQNIQRILIRATDLNGATEAKLKGVTLDLATPSVKLDTRPLALGIEMCQCSKKYRYSSVYSSSGFQFFSVVMYIYNNFEKIIWIQSYDPLKKN